MIRFIFIFLVFLNLHADVWSGADYAKNSSVQLSHGERLLNGLVLKGDEQILDIGCGDGKITAMFAEKVPQGFVYGIDPSESMLKKASSHCFDNLAFEKQSAESFSFETQFDHIIAIHVMHWVLDQQTALQNIHKHLKAGGHIHFVLAPSKKGLPYYTALQKTLKKWEDRFTDFVNPQQVYDIETYRQYVVESGFHVESLYYVYHESIHENKKKLKAWIQQWNPYAKHLSSTESIQFLDDLLDVYLVEIGHSPDTLEQVPWGEYVLFVEAKK